MNRLTPFSVSLFYGIAVVGNGMIRYFGQTGGETGLWFGIVMGTIALLAAICFQYCYVRTGTTLIWVTILTVGGWFIFEALIEKGLFRSEIRMLVIIAITLVVAIFFLKRSFNTRQPGLANSENTNN